MAPAPLRSSVDAPGHALVTGHDGFIGRNLARRLAQEGAKVTGASRAQGTDVVYDDLALGDVDHVYHLAGLSFVPDSWADPASFHLVNTHGTVRVLDQCRRAGIGMTFVSTYVYGPPAQLPVAETAPARPNNPYAFSKFAAEQACGFFASTFGVPVSVLRLFNVYGPGQHPSFLVPTVAAQAVDPSVDEIVVADLAPRRDFVHVDDVVNALLIAPRLPAGGVFNVGYGSSRSVGEVIEACLDAAGVAKPFRARGETRVNEVPDVVADVSAIEAACGWRPQIDFHAGIKTVIEALKPC